MRRFLFRLSEFEVSVGIVLDPSEVGAGSGDLRAASAEDEDGSDDDQEDEEDNDDAG